MNIFKQIQKQYNLTALEAEEIWFYWKEKNTSPKQGCLKIILFFIFMMPVCLLVNNPFFQSLDFTVKIVLGIVIMIGGFFSVWVLIDKLIFPNAEKRFWEYMKTHNANEVLEQSRKEDL